MKTISCFRKPTLFWMSQLISIEIVYFIFCNSPRDNGCPKWSLLFRNKLKVNIIKNWLNFERNNKQNAQKETLAHVRQASGLISYDRAFAIWKHKICWYLYTWTKAYIKQAQTHWIIAHTTLCCWLIHEDVASWQKAKVPEIGDREDKEVMSLNKFPSWF